MRCARGLPLLTLAVCGAVSALALPVGASPNDATTSKSVRLERIAGTCPKSIAIVTRTRQYEGGAEFQIVAQTSSFAEPVRIVSRLPGRIEYLAVGLGSPYTDCMAAARFTDGGSYYSFTLHDGTLRFVFMPAHELRLMRSGVLHGNPSLTLAVAD
jgi:hypothetical protein